MTNEPEIDETTETQKYCGGCGQKNFRPNRSLKELLVEFVEDWLGFDSKIYKTFSTLIVPAKLSKDYFANSHHKNHYITPIRLYLLLSVIFFIMAQFGGLNVTEIDINDPDSSVFISDSEAPNLKVNSTIAIESEEESAPLDEHSESIEQKTGRQKVTEFILEHCNKSKFQLISNLWPQWLDSKVDSSVNSLCVSFKNISYLPKEQQKQAEINLGLNIVQNIIEIFPQVFFLSLPILSLFLGLFYFLSKRLYVEHLVLLMHSHSFIFAVALLYLIWFQVVGAFPTLDVIPLDPILILGIITYLYLSQKWFYQQGWWSTLWRFCIFGIFIQFP